MYNYYLVNKANPVNTEISTILQIQYIFKSNFVSKKFIQIQIWIMWQKIRCALTVAEIMKMTEMTNNVNL